MLAHDQYRHTVGEGPGTLRVTFNDLRTGRVDERRQYQRRSSSETLTVDVFTAASHELRAPLTSLLWYADLLRDPASGPLTPEQSGYLTGIKRTGDRLARLIEDILTIGRLDAGALELHPSPLNLSRLLAEVAADHQGTAAASGITLTLVTEDGPPLTADPLRLRQILDNLVTNALRYTPPPGQVALSAVFDPAPLDPESSHPGTWRIRVSDSGIGVPAQDRRRIFRLFIQGSNIPVPTGEAVPGTGLGLPISTLLVQLHGGTITLEDSPEWSTTFTVALPALGTGHD